MRRLLMLILCVGFSLAGCQKQQSGNDDEIVDTTLNDVVKNSLAASQTMNVDENLTTEPATSPRDIVARERSTIIREPTNSDQDEDDLAEVPAEERTGPSRATGADIRTIFSADDYPASAQAAGAEGTVRARLTVGPDGSVVSCEVIESTGNAALNSTTCNIIRRRARFTPARDANGERTTDTVITPPIRWQLEG